MASQEDIIAKVRACWAIAENAGATEGEKEAAINRAKHLMAKHSIDEILIQEKSGKREDIILLHIRMTVDGQPVTVKDQRIALGWVISQNYRCRGVVETREETADVVTGKRIKGGTFLTVCGYRSDCEFVRDLYFDLTMDMMAAVNTEKVQTVNYRENFCAGYVTRIGARLKAIKRYTEKAAENVEGGSLLPAIVDRDAKVDDFFTKMYPDLVKVKVSKKKYDPNAQLRGSRAADQADIGQSKVGGGGKGEIGTAKKELGS